MRYLRLSVMACIPLIFAPQFAFSQSDTDTEANAFVIPDPITPQRWSDSYSVNGQCYCDTTYDHYIGNLEVETPVGIQSVRQVCELIEDKLGEGPEDGRIYYNTIQCGYGPVNDDPENDEVICPGIPIALHNYTGNRCHEKGATWNLDTLYGTTYTDDNNNATVDDHSSNESEADNDQDNQTQETANNIAVPTMVYRVNAGGGALGQDWISDNAAKSYVSNGNIWGKPTAINRNGIDNSVPTAVFQSERWYHGNQSPMHWKFPVTPGKYLVNLYFAEIWSGAMKPRGRVFDVTLEQEQIKNIDIYTEAGGFTAVKKSIELTSDSTLDIRFVGVIQNPSVKGIEIIALTNSTDHAVDSVDSVDDTVDTVDTSQDTVSEEDSVDTENTDRDFQQTIKTDSVDSEDSQQANENQNHTSEDAYNDTTDQVNTQHEPEQDSDTSVSATVSYLVNAGGSTIQHNSGLWASDSSARKYATAGHAWTTNKAINTAPINGDVPAKMFQSERWYNTSGSNMHWKFPVSPGRHEVTLYFAEIWSGGLKAGARVFDVTVENKPAVRVDVFAEAGGFTALEKVFTVDSDSQLDIELTGVKQNPAIKGIKITALNTTNSESKTTEQEQEQEQKSNTQKTDSSTDQSEATKSLLTQKQQQQVDTLSCEVSAASLTQAKQLFATNCSLPRKDCDPKKGGGWICSSENL